MEYSEEKQKKTGELMFQNNVGNQSDQDVGNQSDQQDNALVYTNSNVSVQDNEANNSDHIVPEQEKVPYKVKGLESLQKLDKEYKRIDKVGGENDIDNFNNSYGNVQQAYEGEIDALMGEKNKKLFGSKCGEIAQIYAQLRYARKTDKWSSGNFKNVCKNFETFLKSLEDDDPKKTLEDLKKAKDSAEIYKTGHGHYDKKDKSKVSTTQRNTLLKVKTMECIVALYSYCAFSEAVNEHITDEEDKNLTEVYEELMGKDFAPSGKKSTIREQGKDSLYYAGNGHYTDNGVSLVGENKADTNVKNPGPSLQRMFENLGISEGGLARDADSETGFIAADNSIMNLFTVMNRGSANSPNTKYGNINCPKILNDWKNTIAELGNEDLVQLMLHVTGVNLANMEKDDYDKLSKNFSLENYDKMVDAFIKDRDQKNNGDLSYRQVPIAYEKNGKVDTKNEALDYKFSGAKDIVKKLNLGPFAKYYDEKFFNKVKLLLLNPKMDEAKKELYKPIWYIMFNNPKDIEKLVNKIYFKNCIKFISYIGNMYTSIGTYWYRSRA